MPAEINRVFIVSNELEEGRVNMFRGVTPRYGNGWYEKNNTSCAEKGLSFAVATGLKVAPFLVLFNGRRIFTGGKVVWREVLVKSAWDTLSTGAAVGLFLGSYCSINNLLGVATIGTAAVSAGMAASMFSLRKPAQMPLFFLGGATFAGVLWSTSWQLQAMAEEQPTVTQKK